MATVEKLPPVEENDPSYYEWLESDSVSVGHHKHCYAYKDLFCCTDCGIVFMQRDRETMASIGCIGRWRYRKYVFSCTGVLVLIGLFAMGFTLD